MLLPSLLSHVFLPTSPCTPFRSNYAGTCTSGSSKQATCTPEATCRHLIIDKDTPLTPTMFAAPEHTLDWFEGAGPTPLFGAWTSLAIVRSAARARVNGLAHASKVMTTLRAGPGAPAPPVSKLFFR